MNKSGVLRCGLFLLCSQMAHATDSAQSIMFEADKDHGHLTTLPPQQAGAQQDKCARLAKEIEDLKGKPQRRFAASQQYQAECQR